MGPAALARPAADLPGPRPRWLSGNLQDYERDRLAFLESCRAYGDLARFDSLTTVVNAPALVAQLLDDPAGQFRQEENFLGRRLGPAEWEQVATLRRLLNPHLRARAVAELPTLTADLLVRRFDLRGERAFDPLPVLEHVLPTAVVHHFLGAGAEHLVPRLTALLDALARLVGSPWALPAFTHSPVHRRIERHHRDVHGAVLDVLRTGDDGAGAAILRAATAQGVPADRVADLLTGAMLAAIRVPAASTAWLLMLMADGSDVQAELADADGPTARTHAQRVVLEALRLFPATWLVTRTAARPVVLGDVAFPEGHHFLVSPYALHRDPRLFPRPLSFLPERWEGLRPESGAYVPFGRGIGRCPGRDLASATMVEVLLAVLDRWEVRRAPGLVTADPRTTLMPRGLDISLVRRCGSAATPPASTR